MKLADRIHLVGSGTMGFDLTDPFDCHVFLIDAGDELLLIDAGSGMGAEAIIENVRADGFDPGRIRTLVLTHAHVDHAGGAGAITRMLDRPAVLCSGAIAGFVQNAEEQGVSLDVARKAGFYPPDYVLEPCGVDRELSDGDRIEVGDLELRGHRDTRSRRRPHLASSRSRGSANADLRRRHLLRRDDPSPEHVGLSVA